MKIYILLAVLSLSMISASNFDIDLPDSEFACRDYELTDAIAEANPDMYCTWTDDCVFSCIDWKLFGDWWRNRKHIGFEI